MSSTLEPLVPPLPVDEEHARVRLDVELRRRAARVAWAGEAHDPPDVWLELDGTRYAVEVTSIQFATSRQRSSAEEFGRQRSAIGKVVAELNASGRVHGSWILRSEPFDSVQAVRRHVEAALLEFFASGRSDQVDELDLGIDGFEATLRRGQAAGDLIHHMPMDVGDYDPEADAANLRVQLQRAITGKARKMANVPRPWILAVIDGNGWERDRWEAMLPEEAERFDAVYRVENERAVLVRAAASVPRATR